MTKLSVVIPVFNEERYVYRLLRKVLNVKLHKVEKEIIVVNDGSTDNSLVEIKRFVKENKSSKIIVIDQKRNFGKGKAVSTGIKRSSGNIVLIQDADLEYDPNQYTKLIDPIVKNKTNVVYGTRLINYPLNLAGRHKTPLLTHYLGNIFITKVTNLLYSSNLTDMETCYKVFKGELIRKIKIDSLRFEFEPEVTAKILKSGEKILEVPIKVSPRGYHEGKKITWKDGFAALKTLFKYRFLD